LQTCQVACFQRTFRLKSGQVLP